MKASSSRSQLTKKTEVGILDDWCRKTRMLGVSYFKKKSWLSLGKRK